MTIDYKILVGEKLSHQEEMHLSRIVETTFEEIDSIYNKWNLHSELSKLNQLNAGVPQKLSPKLHHLLQFTDHIVRISEGRFDPTIEPLQQLWKLHLEQKTLPSQKDIQSIAKFVGWNKIHFHDGVFIKEHNETSLDLGGIVKGYAVDLLLQRFNGAGFSDVYVEWGGEIKASGQHPDKRPWAVFISNLGDNSPQHAIAHVNLKDQAIATSGDYLQFWQISQQNSTADINKQTITYCHVINPKTLSPLEIRSDSIASVSVLASSCILADALATSVMLFSSLSEAKTWIENIQNQYPDTTFWVVTRKKNEES